MLKSNNFFTLLFIIFLISVIFHVSCYATPTYFTDVNPTITLCHYAGKITIGDTNAVDYKDEVGVFVKDGNGGEMLVGACVIGDSSPGYYMVNIYGDDIVTEEKDGAIENDELIFKVWDQSKQKEYTIPSSSMTYESADGYTRPNIPAEWSVLTIFGLLNLHIDPIRIINVFPDHGVLGRNLEVTVTGTGFDEETRILMNLDVGHKKAIVGSVKTPIPANSVTVADNKAYVTDYKSLQIIDISNPETPEIIGFLDIPGWSVLDVAVAGDKAYVVNGGIQVVDVSIPENPSIIGSVNISGALSVTLSDNMAYVVADGGLQVIDISNPVSPHIIGSIETQSAHGIVVAGGNAYVAVGDSGLLVISISNPKNPVFLGVVNTPGFAYDVNVADNKAYVADEDSLQIIDISNPGNPHIISSVETGGYIRDLTVTDDRVYVADGNGLGIIDISNPESPQVISLIDTQEWSRVVAVADGKAYVACGAGLGTWNGLYVIDVSNPEIIENIGLMNTPDRAAGVAVADNKAYVADLKGGLQVIDVSNPGSPKTIGAVDRWSEDTPIHAQDVAVEGDKAYVACGGDNSWSGLQVIDISDPKDPQIIRSVVTQGCAVDVAVSNGNAYVACRTCNGDISWNGVQVINIEVPFKPEIIGSVDLSGPPNYITVAGDEAYVACGTGLDSWNGLQIIDISTPDNPQITSSVDMPDHAASVAVSGGNAYVVCGGNNIWSGLKVIDISKDDPRIIGSVDTPILKSESGGGIAVEGVNAYIAHWDNGLLVIDISNPENPQVIGSVDTLDTAYDISVADSMVYLPLSRSGLMIMPAPVEIKPVMVESETKISFTLSSPPIPGYYTLRAFNTEEYGELAGAIAFLPLSKAIIVAGGGNDDSNFLWDKTRLCADYAYNALYFQGYSDENILYLTPDADRGDLNATNANLRYAIENWAYDADELLLYMVDHGRNGAFFTNAYEILYADDLDSYLDMLQMFISCRVIFIYDACESGSFLSRMTPPEGRERIIVASSEPEENAFFLSGGRLSFSYQFWTSVFEGAKLSNAFYLANEMMSPYQKALVDADGDGVSTDNDVKLLSYTVIGKGIVGIQYPPVIMSICYNQSEQILFGETYARLCVSDIIDDNHIEYVWAVITPPDFQPESPNIPVTDLPTIELTDYDNNGSYKGWYDNFTKIGTYKIAIYAMDSEGLYSLPIHLTVIQTLNGVIPGDLNDDGFIDLSDAILALKLLAGMNENYINTYTDINGDGKIGMEEAIYILQKVSGLRSGEEFYRQDTNDLQR